MSPQTQHKILAVEYALGLLDSGMVIGLGAGSTAELALSLLAKKLSAGELRDVVGVACSNATAEVASRLRIPLVSLERAPEVDVTLDGADEVDPQLDLIKGAGGALLREKIVAEASAREVIMVDGTKLSARLGQKRDLPVEVVDFGVRGQLQFLEGLGAKPTIRCQKDGTYVRTDHGNLLVDCKFAELGGPAHLAAALEARAGVVAHGLFLDLATDVIVADDAGIRHFTRNGVHKGRISCTTVSSTRSA